MIAIAILVDVEENTIITEKRAIKRLSFLVFKYIYFLKRKINVENDKKIYNFSNLSLMMWRFLLESNIGR